MPSHSMDFSIEQSITSVVTFIVLAAVSLLQAKHKDDITSLRSLIKKMLVTNVSSSSLTSLADTALKLLLKVKTPSKNER